jgi:cytidylate kinase
MKVKTGFIIAIDGPVAAGKGTLAPALAQKLNGFYFYTGSMYRCLALLCLRQNVDPRNQVEVNKLLPLIELTFKEDKIFLHDEDITREIKKQEVAQTASIVAAMPKVREVLGQKQREIGLKSAQQNQVVVTEGRDQGTKIFPDAQMKIFLTASPEIRTQRRLLQLHEMGDTKRDFNTLLEEVKQRDKQDQERATDPLVKEPEKYGYLIIDDSNLTKEQTITIVMHELQKRGLIEP